MSFKLTGRVFEDAHSILSETVRATPYDSTGTGETQVVYVSGIFSEDEEDTSLYDLAYKGTISAIEEAIKLVDPRVSFSQHSDNLGLSMEYSGESLPIHSIRAKLDEIMSAARNNWQLQDDDSITQKTYNQSTYNVLKAIFPNGVEKIDQGSEAFTTVVDCGAVDQLKTVLGLVSQLEKS